MIFVSLPFRKKQQGSVGSAVIGVSAALSDPLSSEYLPHHDGLLGCWALQETLLPRPAQPVGFNICPDIFQDHRGIERGTWGKRVGAAGWTANRRKRHTTGYMYFKNTKVWRDRLRKEESIRGGQTERKCPRWRRRCSPNQRRKGTKKSEEYLQFLG